MTPYEQTQVFRQEMMRSQIILKELLLEMVRMNEAVSMLNKVLIKMEKNQPNPLDYG